jgi:rhodanese-related sulfurtransferase
MKYIVIDVREPSEYQTGHVAGALNIPPSELMNGAEELNTVPKDSHIIVYCRSGSRSNVASNILTNLGFTNITNGINKEQVEAKFDLS